MSPDERAQFWASMYRIRANAHRVAAARDDLDAAAIEAAASMRRLGEAYAAAEAREVAEHPDLAELNVQLDGFYGGAR
jgi:hypothetical protein